MARSPWLKGHPGRPLTPDLLIGTSAGALNAGYVAGHGASREAVDALAAIGVRLRRRDVFPFIPARHALALAGVRESVFSSAGLRQVIASHLAPAPSPGRQRARMAMRCTRSRS